MRKLILKGIKWLAQGCTSYAQGSCFSTVKPTTQPTVTFNNGGMIRLYVSYSIYGPVSTNGTLKGRNWWPRRCVKPWCKRENDLLVRPSVWRLNSAVSRMLLGNGTESVLSWQTHIGLLASFLFHPMSRESFPRGWPGAPRIICNCFTLWLPGLGCPGWVVWILWTSSHCGVKAVTKQKPHLKW